MGWTETFAQYYTNDNKIDRKQECENIFDPKYKIMKSAMVGSTYYAAVQNPDMTVTASVVLTHTRNNTYFAYKAMNESSGPTKDDCPKCILDLLSPTNSQYANDWRQRCITKRQKLNQRNNSPTALRNLPVGTKIEITDFAGNKYICKKMNPCHQFKTTWFLDEDTNKYYPKRFIRNYKIIASK